MICRFRNIPVITVLIFLSGLIIACSSQGYKSTGSLKKPDEINFQVFYDQLSPHGLWTTYQDFGYVWMPDAGKDFFPYASNGKWIMTEYGWTWLSEFPWGWAPFHYGRWNFDTYYGWLWIPGNEWGPAWVTWRKADGYYGWSPMEPGMNTSRSITGGSRDTDLWIFVSDKEMGSQDIQKKYISRNENEEIFKRSSIINNTYLDNNRNVTYVSGPRLEEIQEITGRTINRLTISEYNRPGQRVSGSEVQIYRPRISQLSGKDSSVPARVTDLNEIKPPGVRGMGVKSSP